MFDPYIYINQLTSNKEIQRDVTGSKSANRIYNGVRQIRFSSHYSTILLVNLPTANGRINGKTIIIPVCLKMGLCPKFVASYKGDTNWKLPHCHVSHNHSETRKMDPIQPKIKIRKCDQIILKIIQKKISPISIGQIWFVKSIIIPYIPLQSIGVVPPIWDGSNPVQPGRRKAQDGAFLSLPHCSPSLRRLRVLLGCHQNGEILLKLRGCCR